MLTSTTHLPPPSRLGPALGRCKAPATCGEFVQGAIDGEDFLVNCPIDLYSYAAVYDGQARGLHVRDGQAFGKIARGLGLVAGRLGADVACEIVVESRIPRGKGMASSTADITAALVAACRGCGVSLQADELAALLTAIEPSDCVHFAGIAHVNHLTGRLFDALPAPGDLSVLVVDCGGEVDTLAFDRERARCVYRSHQPEIRAALALLKRGLRQHDEAAVADAATRSALLSQRILPKPPLEELLARTRAAGALGVNCAHSGTVLGVLHRTSDGLADVLRATVERHLGDAVEVIGNHHVIAGGCHDY